jgi:hypothetical protein
MKGVLFLYGCSCYPIRHMRSHAFEVVAPAQSKGSGGASTTSTTPSLNPLRSTKHTYRWFASSVAERDMCVAYPCVCVSIAVARGLHLPRLCVEAPASVCVCVHTPPLHTTHPSPSHAPHVYLLVHPYMRGLRASVCAAQPSPAPHPASATT